MNGLGVSCKCKIKARLKSLLQDHDLRTVAPIVVGYLHPLVGISLPVTGNIRAKRKEKSKACASKLLSGAVHFGVLKEGDAEF